MSPLENSPPPRPLQLRPLPLQLLPQVLELDRRCLGGLWSEAGYRREVESDQSELWVLTTDGIATDGTATRGTATEGIATATLGITEEADGIQTEAYLGSPDSAMPHSRQNAPSQVIAIGCLWAILDEAHVTLLAVDPPWRRQGLGQYLLWGLLGAARSRQLSWAALEVRVSNQLALGLYEKFGFQAIGRRRRYYQDTGEDAAVLWLKGLQTQAFGQNHRQQGQQIYQRLRLAGWQQPSLDLRLQKYVPKS